MPIKGYGALNQRNSYGQPEPVTGPAQEDTMRKILAKLSQLTDRLAPDLNFQPIKFSELAVGDTLTQSFNTVSTFNGFIVTVVAGTISVWLGSSTNTAPDFIFVSGTSSYYLPLPERSDIVLNIVSSGTTPATGTLFITEY